LKTHFADLERVACSSDHAFRLACAAVVALTHQLDASALSAAHKSGRDPLALVVPGLKPPRKKQKRTGQEDQAVMNTLNSTRGKKSALGKGTLAHRPHACTVCRRHGVESHDHRKGGHCPFESCGCKCDQAHDGCTCVCAMRAPIPGTPVVVQVRTGGAGGESVPMTASLAAGQRDNGMPLVWSKQPTVLSTELGFLLSSSSPSK